MHTQRILRTMAKPLSYFPIRVEYTLSLLFITVKTSGMTKIIYTSLKFKRNGIQQLENNLYDG